MLIRVSQFSIMLVIGFTLACGETPNSTDGMRHEKLHPIPSTLVDTVEVKNEPAENDADLNTQIPADDLAFLNDTSNIFYPYTYREVNSVRQYLLNEGTAFIGTYGRDTLYYARLDTIMNDTIQARVYTFASCEYCCQGGYPALLKEECLRYPRNTHDFIVRDQTLWFSEDPQEWGACKHWWLYKDTFDAGQLPTSVGLWFRQVDA